MSSQNLAFALLVSAISFIGPQAHSAHRGFHWDWRASQELIARQCLRNAKLPAHEKHAIAVAIAGQIGEENHGFGPKTKKQLEEAALDTRIKMIDLNGDGVPEVVVQGMLETDCGATGNCPFWVFQKTSRGYKLLLNGFGQTFTIQKESTNGFRDIVVSSHNSATESGLMYYRYRHGAYYEAGEYCAEWTERNGDEVHQLKEPRVSESCTQ